MASAALSHHGRAETHFIEDGFRTYVPSMAWLHGFCQVSLASRIMVEGTVAGGPENYGKPDVALQVNSRGKLKLFEGGDKALFYSLPVNQPGRSAHPRGRVPPQSSR